MSGTNHLTMQVKLSISAAAAASTAQTSAQQSKSCFAGDLRLSQELGSCTRQRLCLHTGHRVASLNYDERTPIPAKHEKAECALNTCARPFVPI